MARQGALLILYVDTSVFVPLLVHEQGSNEARRIVLGDQVQRRVVSDWAVTELASALAMKRRLSAITAQQADAALSRADMMLNSGRFTREHVVREDFERAAALMMSQNLSLRAGDALHVAVSVRIGADLATFDTEMMSTAQAIGLRVNP